MTPTTSVETPEVKPDRKELLLKALAAVDEMQARLDEAEYAKTEPIAIVGLACRFPQAPNADAFWEVLSEGRDAICEVPADRWNADQFYDTDPQTPGKMYTRWGGFLSDVDCFDAGLFRISPREAASMDPQQRLLLEIAWEAFENAGMPPTGLRNTRGGVFFGISTSDYAHFTQLSAHLSDMGDVDAYTGTGNAFSVATGRLSHFFGLQGPSIAVDTACSSSLVAIDLACQNLRSGRCDFALAGGVNVILSPASTVYFCKVGAMAADGRCKTFDSSADGYVRGEGCGAVVLRRLSDAKRDGNEILAVIRGSAVNHDGPSSGLTVPNGHSQEAVIRAALSEAGVKPAEIDYVEAHGTGTPLGDPIEVRALARVFGTDRTPDRPLKIGSVKTNIGHLEAAAGIASLIKLVLAMRNGEIPRSLHFNTPNPHVDWSAIQVKVTSEPITLQSGKPLLAGISSFGFGGTNAHLVIESAPADLAVNSPTAPGARRPEHLLALSAQSHEALMLLAQGYVDLLGSSSPPDLEDVCFAANTGRSHLEHRLAIIAKDAAEAREKLAGAVGWKQSPGVWIGKGAQRKVSIHFTGEPMVVPEEAIDLAETCPAYGAAIDHFAKSLRHASLIEGGKELWDPDGENQDFHGVVHCWALTETLKSWGIDLDSAAGSGTGEFASAVVAEVLSPEEAFTTYRRRRRASSQSRRNPAGQKPAIPWWSSGLGEWIDDSEGAQKWLAWALQDMPDPKSISAPKDERQAVLDLGGSEGWAQLLAKVAQLYVEGIDVDWKAFHGASRHRHVEIPRYPFVRKRYWLPHADPGSLFTTSDSRLKGESRIGEIDSARKRAVAEFALTLRQTPQSERLELLTHTIGAEVASVLGLDSIPSAKQGFFDLGMDSIMAVQLRSRIEDLIGHPLPSTMAFDFPNSEVAAKSLIHLVLDEEQAGFQTYSRSDRRLDSGRIAVIGIGCRFPGGGNDPDSFWQLLSEGKDTVGKVPASRWDADEYFSADPDTLAKSYTSEGAFLDIDVAGFDSKFFEITPREATSMDPQQRLLLELTWEALEHAGQMPESLEGKRVGVYVGINSNDYSRRLIMGADLGSLDAYTFTGNTFSVAAGRVSHFLGIQGPSLSIDTACSSSLMAVHLAVGSLRSEECELAIVGGVSLMLMPDGHVVLSRMRALSKDGRSKAFDSSADGYGRGEGGGVVVLKRLSDAEADGDRILAVIDGSAVNHDGASSGLTVPNGTAQRLLLSEAIRDAGIEPSDVSFVEAHGTGTPLGDPIEMEAIRNVYCQGRLPQNPLLVGAVKSNIGHLEAGAGIASLIKVVISLQHKALPAHLHFNRPSPHIRWEDLPVKIPNVLTEWPAIGGKRIAGVSSFGMSGTNVHVLLEEAPSSVSAVDAVDRGVHVLALSARTESALSELASRMSAHLSSHPEEPFGDVAFTSTSGRSHLTYRSAIVASSSKEALEKLGNLKVRKAPSLAPKIAFMFSGQGAQFQGMGRELYNAQPVFRQCLDRCSELLSEFLPVPLQVAMWESETLLDETLYTQSSLFAFEYSLAQLWRSWGIEPGAVLGHSLGEYVAACISGMMSVEEACRLVGIRASLMQGLPAGGAMAAVLAPEAEVRELLTRVNGSITVAAVNSPRNTVVSGEALAVEQALQLCSEAGMGAQRLRVSHAFHSPLIEPMAAKFGAAASQVAWKAPRMRWVCNLTGESSSDQPPSSDYWVQHALHPVQFKKSIDSLLALGYETFVEIGPGTTLASLGKQTALDTEAIWLVSARRGQGETTQMLETLAELYHKGAKIDWKQYDMPFPRRKLALPTYPFERERFWIEIDPSFRKANTGAADDWFYKLDWIESEAAPTTEVCDGGTWILVEDDHGLAKKVSARLSSEGYKTVTLSPSGPATEVNVLVDTQSREALEAVFRSIQQSEGPHLRGVLFMAGLRADHEGEAGCIGLLHTVQSVISTLSKSPPIWIVTSGVQSLGEEAGPVAVWQAPLWGIGRVISYEHHEVWGGLIDLDPASTNAEESIVAEILADSDEDQIVFRGSRRFVGRLRNTKVPTPTATIELRPEASYLITGGLGSLGLRVASRLAERGAKELILAGRRTPSPEASLKLKRLEAEGVTVHLLQADVGLREELEAAIDRLGAPWSRLAGVVHAAGLLDDGVLMMQNADRFHQVLQPKLTGGWNLHELTLGHPLDFFVMFSSAASILGSPGQSNYAAGNAFLDGLAFYRQGLGLPAVSINWGPWAEAGMASDLAKKAGRRWAPDGVKPIGMSEGLDAFEHLLSLGSPQVLAMRSQWAEFLGQFPPGFEPKSLAEFSRPLARVEATEVRKGPPEFLKKLLAANDGERRSMATTFIQRQVAAVMGLPAGQLPETDQGFFELGLDSLMAIELKNLLSAAVGKDLPPSLMFQCPNIDSMLEYLLRDLIPPETASPMAMAYADIKDEAGDLESEEDLLSQLMAEISAVETRREKSKGKLL